MAKRAQNQQPTSVLTVEEACDYLRISRSGLYRIMKSDRLRPAHIGRRTVFRRSDVDAFLETCIGEVAP